MDSVVRRLGAADAADYRAHRLRGLREHPTAFGSTHARELAMPAEAFAARLERSASFGAFADQALVGIVSVVVAEGPKVGHKGSVVGVYVAAEARGGGVGEALMRAAIAETRGRLELLQLGVAVDNWPARRLYTRCGFEPYGLERRAYREADGGYVDEVLMALFLA